MQKDGEKIGLNFPLLPSNEQDKEDASQIKYKSRTDLELSEKKRKLSLKSSSIFGNTKDSNIIRKAKN